MKFSKVVCMAAVFGALAVSFPLIAQAQSGDNDGCNLSTLKGDYAFRISGQIFNSGGTVVTLRDGIAMEHFDGAGGLTQEDFVLSNGVFGPGPTDPNNGFHIKETGTYKVNPDCTGSEVIDFPTGAVSKAMFVISNQGQTVHGIVSSLTPPGAASPVPANIHADGEKLNSNPEK